MKRLTVVFLFIMMIWSDSDSQMWTKADSLSQKYLLQGKYDSALFYAEESAAILRGTLGEKNLRYASALTRLAVAQYYLGNYKKAEYYILKDAELRESLKAANDQEYLNTLRTASVICRKSGNYDEALTQIHKADAASRKILKEDTPQYADLLQSFAAVYHDLGSSVSDMVSFNTEEKYLKRAEAIYLKSGDETTEKLILNKSDQAALNNNIGNSPQAEFLLQEAIDLCLKVYGPASPGYGSALNNLGVLYYNIGNYKLAEKFLVEAVEVCTKSADTRKITKAICLNNLGALYHEMGNYIPAGKLISDAQSLLIEEQQQENPLFSVLLNNQASVIISQEYYATAENKSRERLAKAGRELMKADSIFRLNCRKPHPYYQAMTGNLGIWYNLAGEKDKSRNLLNEMAYDSGMGLRVVAMMSKMSVSSPIPSGPELNQGPDAAIIPISVNLLDQISASNMEGQYTGESDAFTNAILRMALGKANNIKKAVGPYHPAYATMLKMLIVTYASADDVIMEEELKLEYINVVNHKTLQDFSFLSDSEKELYFQTRLPDMHDFTSYSLKRKIKNPGITSHTYNNILLNKGLMLKSSTAMRLAILNSDDPALLRQYDEWIALQKEISVLYATPVEFRTRDVAVLEESANALERSLVASSQDFSTYRNGLQLTWEDVRKSLKPDEAAIEFTDFKKKEKDGGDEVIYCALIVRSNSAYPEMVKLFEENQLKAIIDRSGLNNINDINEIYGKATSQNDLLYNLIWKPIEAYLGDIRNVYISPSGTPE